LDSFKILPACAGIKIDEITGGSNFLLDEGGSEAEIEAVFDSDRDVMFLHITSVMDAYTGAEKCKVRGNMSTLMQTLGAHFTLSTNGCTVRWVSCLI
jgi:hypothetical protein